MPALLLSAALAALVGGAAVIRAQDEPAKPAAPTKKALTVRALTPGGEPLEGVEVGIRHHGPQDPRGMSFERTTAEDGTVRVEYDPAQAASRFSLTLRKPGFVPAYVAWSGERRPIVIPDVKELRLARGTTVGGIVIDESGKEVEGASVTLSMPPTESDDGNMSFTLATATTDARGRWRIDEAPAVLQAIDVRVEHPQYRWSHGRLARGVDGVTAVLKKGRAVKGSVVGPGGEPVAGAVVVLGRAESSSNDPTARTDARGGFALENCDAGPGYLTVEAEGFAPQEREVVVADEGETATPAFALEPGSTIRVRVVDVQGRPVVGAYVAVDRWRERQSIRFRANTDAEGRAAWPGAPKDAVLFDVFLDGYMRARLVPLTAGEERTIVLHPALTISGAVTDAKTGRPVPKFTVFQGRTEEDRDGVNWRRDEPAEFTEGRYVQSVDFPARGHHLRIEAPGYEPAESRAFRSDEGATTQDFALEPRPGLDGVVRLPDGRPAAGAEVALVLPGVYTSLKGDRFERDFETPIQKAGDDGRFSLPKPEGSFLIAAAHDSGFAMAAPADLAKSPALELKPWARIEGRVAVGKRPGAGEEVTFQPHPGRLAPGTTAFGDFGAVTNADAEGWFVLDKVVPVPGYVGRVVVTDTGGGSSTHSPVGLKPLDVKPGETARVDVGGDGRPVVGRVVLEGGADVAVDWAHNEPVQLVLTPAFRFTPFLDQSSGTWLRYAGNFDADGRFRAEDVPPGLYRLTVNVSAPAPADSRRIPETIARGTATFRVPGGDPEAPVDAGDLVARLERTLKPGDEAPALDLERIDGPKGRFVLGDRRGKVVVLDFWATWCGPCRDEFPALKELMKAHGDDPRFELVGVSCDEEPGVAAEFAAKEGLAWAQAFAGPMGGGAAQDYGVRAIPSTFLIGPDGRILAMNLRGDPLKEAVAKALAPPEPPPQKTALVVRVLDAATGGPLEGAEVESSFFDPKADERAKAIATTAADGTARVEHEPGVEPTVLWLIARKPGYVPGSFYRGRGGWGEPFPMPESKEFRLARGVELGGAVVDEAGAPIEGATVELSTSFADSDYPPLNMAITSLKTDARGRWRSAEVPDALKGVSLSISHPDYQSASERPSRGDLRHVLAQGETVTGRVVGPDGRPIAGANVRLRSGSSSAGIADARTDADGRFALLHARPGEFYVMAEADGHAPAFRDVQVKRGGGDAGEVAMGPGETLRVRVVDAEGRPLPDVRFSPSLVRGREWGSSFRGKTDAEGRAAWKDAPPGETTYTFSCRDMMAIRTPLAPGDQERVIVMRPPLVVSGAAVDAVTKRPIPKFRVEYGVIGEGRGAPAWQPDAKDAADGRYTLTFEFPQTYAIRVTARGYKTAESPGFRVDDPGASTRDFALEPQPWLEGAVRRPDGSPDAKAQVALLTPRASAMLNGASFAKGFTAPVAAVDAEGRYAFPRPEPPFLLAAVSEAGYVEAKPEDVARSTDLQLRPWARIEGTVRVGEKPGGGEWVEFLADRRPLTASGLWVSSDDRVQADARGRFALDRIIPRPGHVSRVLNTPSDGRRLIGAEPVDPKPGETTHIDLGGGGRPVVGRATFDGPIDWTRNRPARIMTEYGTLERPEGGLLHTKSYFGEYDRDGRFRIEDVPPGRYRLTIQVDPDVPATPPAQDEPLAKTVRLLVVPAGDLATPVDVGEVAVRPDREWKAGGEAPALDLERIAAAGGRYVLGDRRGRVVVLCFWASWAKPFARLMPMLKELEKAHGGDPRFELVGVSCDDDPAEAARFVRDNGLTWTQTYAGPIGSGAAADFGITNPWSIVLVGPDGRILTTYANWKTFQDEVAKALAGMEPSSTR